MVLWRVFPFDWDDPTARPEPWSVRRDRQGGGRHDNPDLYTALYAARDPASAVAEFLQPFRGRVIGPAAFVRPDGRVRTLAALDDSALPPLVDLDEPTTLVRIGWRPSAIATGVRTTTQRLALERFRDAAVGLSWWSTLEAGWTNVTLFDVRVESLPEVIDMERLGLEQPAVVAAAERLSVGLRA